MPQSNNVGYEFGPYHLDVSKRVLTRAGETISLTPKATEILVLLVLKAGQLVEKDELLKEVWPDTFVEESNLTQNIFTLRRALGDDRAGPKYIETVARRGYRFVASVRAVSKDEQSVESRDQISLAGGVTASARPVVAVLPFVNTTGDPELEYLAEGVTDNIINNLSRVSKLRVMSRSAVFRYKAKVVDPQQAGRDLGVTAVLVGTIGSRPSGMAVGVELVEVATGWQLWGEYFDSTSKDILQIQEAITRQLLQALKLKLTGEEERSVTARYTENAQAYEAYLEGRYHWSRYTKKGIEKAIGHFRHAIELDPKYALAYAGIVDCYLRLATNYLPPEGEVPRSGREIIYESEAKSDRPNESDPRIKLRFEWDWKAAERELRRANDLKTDYPAAHQWYVAYLTCKQLYEEVKGSTHRRKQAEHRTKLPEFRKELFPHIGSLKLTLSEQVQVYCAIVREQIDAGNYEAGCKLLCQWWSFGNWPRFEGLNQQSYADLLFTAGELAGFLASSVQMSRGQKHGEELLNGSVALYEQLGLCGRAAEARIELALCYHRQGLFDIGRTTLVRVLSDLSDESWELRSLALMRLGSLERNAGRLKDALERLIQATRMAEVCGPWITARCHLELASIYKDLAISEDVALYVEKAKHFYLKALYEFEAVGHHRYVAVVENNIGLLLLGLGLHGEAEIHLLSARRFFDSFADTLRGAQVNDTLARLYIETKRYPRAQEVIEQAVRIFELADSDAILADALITKGILQNRLGQFSDAKKSFEAACRISERCSDTEGAGLALLIMFEEMSDQLERAEKIQMAEKLKKLLATTQQTKLQIRLQRLIGNVANNPTVPSNQPEK